MAVLNHRKPDDCKQTLSEFNQALSHVYKNQLSIKDKDIPEKSKGVLLGLSWDRDMSWIGQMEIITVKYNKKVGGIMKVCGFLDFQHRKSLEGLLRTQTCTMEK